jgi:endonuclease/exonuclease/phosphatase family metal-dependent hydrolase
VRKIFASALIAAAALSGCAHSRAPRMAPQAAGSCRSDVARWYAPDDAKQRARLDSWCAGVGPVTISQSAAAPAERVPLSDIAFVSWNVHVGNGRVGAFVDDLRAGRWTNGRAPRNVVLLLQEAVRLTGVPDLERQAKGARRISAAHQDAEDIEALSRALGLSMVYTPSMRNGKSARDPAADRGNAILSTLPLSNATAVELPIERQRRVALFATIPISDAEMLHVGVIHLDATDAAHHLWVLGSRSWRATQAAALESVLPAGTLVVGADLNTWLGSGEPASQYFHRLFANTSANSEGSRPGRRVLDYLFFRGAESAATAQYQVVSNKYGSDHYPLIGWFNN